MFLFFLFPITFTNNRGSFITHLFFAFCFKVRPSIDISIITFETAVDKLRIGTVLRLYLRHHTNGNYIK